jgi:translation initiation factor 3 subunit D
MAEAPSIARFVFPQIQDNPNGWGPCEVPVQFKDTPYQPFSKDDRLGKVPTAIVTNQTCIYLSIH